jgi:hypothetical protein
MPINSPLLQFLKSLVADKQRCARVISMQSTSLRWIDLYVMTVLLEFGRLSFAELFFVMEYNSNRGLQSAIRRMLHLGLIVPHGAEPVFYSLSGSGRSLLIELDYLCKKIICPS